MLIASLAATLMVTVDFKTEQMRFPRVREAFEQKGESMRALFKSHGVPYPCRNIFLRAFKQEGVLELWAAPTRRAKYKLLKVYRVTASSGTLGPKRIEGDRQVPEGFYEVTSFNPNSQFWLSLRVSYPNASDRLLADKKRPGSDIYIHGDQVTIGCIPIGNEGIKEVYAVMVEARNAGQARVPVHIFPFRLTDEAIANLERLFDTQPDVIDFWRNLKIGFDIFEKTGRPPKAGVDSKGLYRF
jgi:murein L,D-transpeptidase YafK